MSSGFYANAGGTGLNTGFFSDESGTTPTMMTTPFSGQLTQNGNAVSTTNRLPVDVSFPAAPEFPTAFRVTNTDGQPIPVKIVASNVDLGTGGTSSGTPFDGIITNPNNRPIPVIFPSTPNVGITGLVNVSGSLSIAGITPSGGTLPVSLTSVPTHGVTIQGTPSVSLSGQPTVSIAGTVPVSLGSAKLKIDDTTPLNVNTNVTFPSVQTVRVDNSTLAVTVSGTPTVNANVNFPAQQNITGLVGITTMPSVTVANPFDGALKLAGQAVSSSNRLPVDVGFPTVQPVSIAAPVSVTGSVTATLSGQPTVALASNSVVVSNAVKVDSSTPLKVEVTNPSSGGGSFDGNVTVLGGTLNVGNFPATQAVSGTVNANVTFPATQNVGGTVTVANPVTAVTATISGTPTVALASNSVVVSEAVEVKASTPLNVTVTNSPSVQMVQVTNPQTSVSITGIPTVAVQGTVPVSIAAPVSVNTATGVTTTDRSGTITTGGTAQALAPADAARRGALIQNNSTGDLWVSDVGTATIGGSSIRIPAGMAFEWPSHGIPVTALSIIGATTGQAFMARVW